MRSVIIIVLPIPIAGGYQALQRRSDDPLPREADAHQQAAAALGWHHIQAQPLSQGHFEAVGHLRGLVADVACGCVIVCT